MLDDRDSSWAKCRHRRAVRLRLVWGNRDCAHVDLRTACPGKTHHSDDLSSSCSALGTYVVCSRTPAGRQESRKQRTLTPREPLCQVTTQDGRRRRSTMLPTPTGPRPNRHRNYRHVRCALNVAWSLLAKVRGGPPPDGSQPPHSCRSGQIDLQWTARRVRTATTHQLRRPREVFKLLRARSGLSPLAPET